MNLKINRAMVTALIYTNPFDLNDFERVDVQYDGATLSKLIEGANPEISLFITINGKEIEPEDYETTVPSGGDIVTIFTMPAGGEDPIKDILRIAAIIAIAVLTMNLYAAQMYWTAAAVAVGGNLLVNALLPYEIPNLDASNGFEDSPTYGIDGAKNTSREGIPVPVTFGRNRIAGNIVGLYSENIGDNQFINILVNLGEGEQAGYSDLKLNDIEASVFNAQVEYRSGTAEQALIPKFESAREVRTFGYTFGTKGDELVFTTDNIVSRIRLSANIPQLYTQIKGEIMGGVATMELLYRKVGTTDWHIFQTGVPKGFSTAKFPATIWPGIVLEHVEKVIDGRTYKVVVDLNDYKDFSMEGKPKPSHQDPRVYQVSLLKGVNKATGQVELIGEWYAFATPFDREELTMYDPKNGVHKVASKHLVPKRFNLSTPQLEPARYEIKLVRTHESVPNEEPDGEPYPSDWVLTEIDEVLPFGINYRHTALIGLRVQVTDQFQSIPTVTLITEGLVIRVYDDETETWKEEASNNPAWIAYNCYTNTRWGAGYEDSRMDLPAFVNWAKDCTENGWLFNGTFDTASSLHDQMKNIFKIGHARIIMLGTLFSVSVIKDKSPSMMFNTSNIIKGSLEISWSSDDDRANEIDVIYYDAENNYERTEFKIYDQESFERGDKSKSASLTLHGVTGYEQAYKEAIYALNMNKISQSVKFSSTLEGKDVQIGDVVLIQHNMPRWSEGGKLDTGSTLRTLVLDRAVTLGADEHEVLVQFPSLRLADTTVQRVSGDRVYVNNDIVNASQLVIGGKEYVILSSLTARAFKVNKEVTAAVGATVMVYGKDVIQSRLVAEKNGTFTELTLLGTEPSLPMPPGRFSWSLGKRTLVTKPFMVTSVQTDDPYEYEISAMEFLPELLLTEPVTDLPVYTFNPSLKPEGVQNLTLFVEKQGRGTLQQNVLTANWGYASSNMYQRADVYVSVDDGEVYLAQQGARNSFQMLVRFGQSVLVYVAANNGQVIQPLKDASFSSITVTATDQPVKPSTVTAELVSDEVLVKWTPAQNSSGDSILAEYTLFRAAGTNASWPESYVQLSKAMGLFFYDEQVAVSTQYSYAILATSVFGDSSEVAFATITTPASFDLRAREGVETQYFNGPNTTSINDAGTPTTNPTQWTAVSDPSYKFQATRYYKEDEKGAWTVSFIMRTEVALTVQYSPDGLAQWSDAYRVSDLYMRQSNDGGVTWGPAIRIVGENGAAGDYVDYKFKNSATQPATPLGPTPSGWTDSPTGTVVWMSRVKRRSNGELLEAWSTPVRLTGKDGAAGASSVIYWIDRSETVIKRKPDGSYDIPTIDVTAKYQIGANAPTAYSGRFKIFTKNAAGVWSQAYNSTANQSSHTFTVPAGIDAIRFELYDTNLALVDEEMTVIVEDGVGYDVRIESTNGNIFRPGEGTQTTLKARVFRNGTEITDELAASRFRWRRVSMSPKPAPNDDATWDATYSTGYKQLLVTVDDVDSRATFYCDLLI